MSRPIVTPLKVAGGFGEKSCVSTGVKKARKHICVVDRHEITLAVKVALNLHNQPTNHSSPLLDDPKIILSAF